jgi:hypothetical protein
LQRFTVQYLLNWWKSLSINLRSKHACEVKCEEEGEVVVVVQKLMHLQESMAAFSGTAVTRVGYSR